MRTEMNILQKNQQNFLRRMNRFVNQLTVIFILLSIGITVYIFVNPVKRAIIFKKSVKHYLVHTSGCQMPDYNDTLNHNFYKSIPKPINCSYKNSTKPLVLSDESSIWVDEDALSSYGITDIRNVHCCYTELYRPPTKDPNETEYPVRYGKTCKKFWRKENIYAEYIRINCSNNKILFYNDFHFFVPIKADVDERCATFSKGGEKLNILILGLDSVSRLSFHRTMKKTSRYLKYDLGAVEMLGYNKIAADSIGNMVPVFTGLLLKELSKICFQKDEEHLDRCQFIWKDYTFDGYQTAFVEDSADHAIFENMRKGFNRPPTDYYSPTFYYPAEKEIGSRKENANLCIGSRLLFQTLLDYADKFVRAMSYRPYFGFFWESSLTHEGFNLPFLADKTYLSFLEKVSSYENFNNTVLVIMSDHGYQKYDSYYKFTKLGQLEERRPLLLFVFPAWFRKKYSKAYNNLRTNAKGLVTPFDVYESLKDLMKFHDNLNEDVLANRTEHLIRNDMPRGISLFLPIPERRTCESAHIQSSLCTCDKRYSMNVNNTHAKYFAKQVIAFINNIISKYPQCANVSLNRILDASIAKPRLSLLRNNNRFDCRIVIETSPGNMTFEATVDDMVDKYKSESYNEMEVMETIHTASMYHKYSKCVKLDKIKPFCYCTYFPK